MNRLFPQIRHGRFSGEDASGDGIEGRYFALTWLGLTIEISVGR